jgi:hypothetical protein
MDWNKVNALASVGILLTMAITLIFQMIQARRAAPAVGVVPQPRTLPGRLAIWFLLSGILSALAIYGSFSKPGWLILTSKEWKDYPKTEVVRQRFSHETVVLDGHDYINCTFDQVTFVYDGIAPFSLTGETSLIQPVALQTRNMRIAHYLFFLTGAGLLPDTHIVVRDGELIGNPNSPK